MTGHTTVNRPFENVLEKCKTKKRVLSWSLVRSFGPQYGIFCTMWRSSSKGLLNPRDSFYIVLFIYRGNRFTICVCDLNNYIYWSNSYSVECRKLLLSNCWTINVTDYVLKIWGLSNTPDLSSIAIRLISRTFARKWLRDICCVRNPQELLAIRLHPSIKPW